MPNINDMKESKYLKRSDVGAGKLLTIIRCNQENCAMENDAPEMKWVLHFAEDKKGMVLNSTNAQLIGKALGSDETDEWNGRKIVLFDDPNVSYAGKLVGGIRCRAPKNQAAAPAPAPAARPTPPPVNAAESASDSDLPF